MSVTVRSVQLSVVVTTNYDIADAQGEVLHRSKVHRYDRDFAVGTGDDQLDVIWEDSSRSLAAAPVDLDLVGGLTGADGSAISAFKEVGLLMIENLSTTAADTLTIGNVANGIAGTQAGLGANTHSIIVGPRGLLLLVSPEDGEGVQLTAGTADLLRLNPGAKTFNTKVIVAGHSV